jgi:hypothetical protein
VDQADEKSKNAYLLFYRKIESKVEDKVEKSSSLIVE